MAELRFTVQGVGGTPFPLPVQILVATPVVLTGLETKDVVFEVTNPMDRDVVLTSVLTEVKGPAAAKVNASLLFDAMTIPASGTLQNTLNLESVEAIYEGETFEVEISGQE